VSGGRCIGAQVSNLCGQRNSDSSGSGGGRKLREEFPQCRTGCKPVLRRFARALCCDCPGTGALAADQ
jgi:hypothetical protein